MRIIRLFSPVDPIVGCLMYNSYLAEYNNVFNINRRHVGLDISSFVRSHFGIKMSVFGWQL